MRVHRAAASRKTSSTLAAQAFMTALLPLPPPALFELRRTRAGEVRGEGALLPLPMGEGRGEGQPDPRRRPRGSSAAASTLAAAPRGRAGDPQRRSNARYRARSG